MTSGAIQHIANYDAPRGQRGMADGAEVGGFAGYLNAIFIDWRRTLAAAVIADQQVSFAVQAYRRAAVLAGHMFQIGRRH